MVIGVVVFVGGWYFLGSVWREQDIVKFVFLWDGDFFKGREDKSLNGEEEEGSFFMLIQVEDDGVVAAEEVMVIYFEGSGGKSEGRVCWCCRGKREGERLKLGIEEWNI